MIIFLCRITEFGFKLCFKLAIRLWATHLISMGTRKNLKLGSPSLSYRQRNPSSERADHFLKEVEMELVISETFHLPFKAPDMPAETSH